MSALGTHPYSRIWYQKVSLCLCNPALAGRADVNLTPESSKGGRSLVGMFFHPFSHDCKLGGFVVLKPLLTDQSIKGFLGSPPFPVIPGTLQRLQWIPTQPLQAQSFTQQQHAPLSHTSGG